MRRTAVAYVAILGVMSCGQWQRVGSTDQPQPGTTLPRLFDAATTYRSMGLLVGRGTLPFVADVRYLAGSRPDSALAVIAVSLTNQSLDFQKNQGSNEFVADYRVEATFASDSGTPITAARDERVRVRTFQETLRADESVIFQQIVRLPSRRYTITLMVRDVNGSHTARAERVDTVPRFATPALARPIAYYEGTGRSTVDSLPKIIANPKSTLPYGGDTLRFYVEAYGVPAGTPVAAQVVDQGGAVLWRDTVRSRGGPLAAARFGFPPTLLSVGHAAFEVTAAGLTTRASMLVSFSGQWVITNLDDMVYLLRFFERQDQVEKLRKSLPVARDSAWKEFWTATDPAPITPQNEALDEYFRRLQLANQEFRDEAEQGWLTDRGEVFITLGRPDDVLDMSSGMDRTGVRTIRWTYNELRLTLFFLDQGFGRFQLTPTSRADYQRVLARVRRSQ